MVLLEGSGAWPEGGDLALSVGGVQWEGVGRGHGHLRAAAPRVRVSGRRAAGRVSECSLWLPAGSGAVEGAPADADGRDIDVEDDGVVQSGAVQTGADAAGRWARSQWRAGSGLMVDQ